jgi:hypothetical protein
MSCVCVPLVAMASWRASVPGKDLRSGMECFLCQEEVCREEDVCSLFVIRDPRAQTSGKVVREAMIRASLILGFLAAASAFTPGAYLPKANVRARGTAFVFSKFQTILPFAVTRNIPDGLIVNMCRGA